MGCICAQIVVSLLSELFKAILIRLFFLVQHIEIVLESLLNVYQDNYKSIGPDCQWMPRVEERGYRSVFNFGSDDLGEERELTTCFDS